MKRHHMKIRTGGFLIFLLLPVSLHAASVVLAPEKPAAHILDETLTLRDVEYVHGGPGILSTESREAQNERIRLAAAYYAAARLPLAATLTSDPTVMRELNNVRRILLRNMLWQENVNEKAFATEEEARQWYDSHKETYQMGERVEFKHIYFAKEGSTHTGAADQRAKEAHQELLSGKSFDEVARRWSDANPPGNKISAFLHDLGPVVRDVVKNTPAGKFSTPFPTEYGMEIVLVLQAPVTQYRQFETEKEIIRDNLSFDRQAKAAEVYRASIEKKYPSKILLPAESIPSASENAVIMQVGNQKYTKKEFLEFLNDEGVVAQDLNTEARIMNALTNYVNDRQLVMEIKSTKFTDSKSAKRALLMQDAAWIGERVIAALVQESLPASDPDDNTLRIYYNNNISRFTTPEQISGREIVLNLAVEGETLSLGKQEYRRRECAKTLRELQDRLREGENFSDLAKKYSQSSTASQGGLIPLTSQTDSLFASAVRDLKPGQISNIQSSAGSLSLYKLEERIPGKPLSFEEAHPRVLEAWWENEKKTKREKVLNKLLADSRYEQLSY